MGRAGQHRRGKPRADQGGKAGAQPQASTPAEPFPDDGALLGRVHEAISLFRMP
jgi:hypothetical protein